MSEETKPNGMVGNELDSSIVSATSTASESLTRPAVQHESSGDAPTRPLDAYILRVIGPIAQLYFSNILLTGPGHLQLLIKTLGAIAIIFRAKIAEPGRMSMPTGLAALAALLYSREYGPHEFTSCMNNDGLPMSLEDYLGVILDVVYSDYLRARCDARLSSSSSTGSTHYEGVVTAGSPARVDDEAASEHEHPSSKNNEGMCDGRYFDATAPASPERSTVQRVVSGDAPSFDAHVLGTISTRARLYFEGFHTFGALSLPI